MVISGAGSLDSPYIHRTFKVVTVRTASWFERTAEDNLEQHQSATQEGPNALTYLSDASLEQLQADCHKELLDRRKRARKAARNYGNSL